MGGGRPARTMRLTVEGDRSRGEAADHDSVTHSDDEGHGRERDDERAGVDGREDEDREDDVDEELVHEQVAGSLSRAREERQDSGGLRRKSKSVSL